MSKISDISLNPEEDTGIFLRHTLAGFSVQKTTTKDKKEEEEGEEETLGTSKRLLLLLSNQVIRLRTWT